MKQSPSWKGKRSSVSHKIPHVLWNLEVQYCTYMCPPPDPVHSQINPVHAFPSCFLKTHFNIILPSMPTLPTDTASKKLSAALSKWPYHLLQTNSPWDRFPQVCQLCHQYHPTYILHSSWSSESYLYKQNKLGLWTSQ